MKFLKITIAGALLITLAAGVVALVKFHPSGGADSDNEESADTSAETIVAVQVGSLKRVTLHHYVTGYGTVQAAPATASASAASGMLASPSAGVVARINVVEGQRVATGDVLVELNSSSVTADYAEKAVKRQKTLYAQHNTSLKSLEEAEAQLALLQVVAPLSGTVTRLNVQPGSAVDATTVVAQVVDLDRLAVMAKFPAAAAAELKPGDAVEIGSNAESLPALAEHLLPVSLSFVSPSVDASDGTISAWAALPPDCGLIVGQFVRLEIATAAHTNCLAAPIEAVVTDESGTSVIALVNQDEATQTPVQTGFRENGWVEIQGPGLKAGDSVVTVGAYGLPEKTKINVVNPGGEQE